MGKRDWFYKFIFGKEYQIPRHLAFWIFIYLDEFLSFTGITPPLETISSTVISLILDVSMVLVNLYFLVPYLLLRKKTISYVALTLVSIVIIIGSNYFLFEMHKELDLSFWEFFSSNLAYNASIVAFAVAIKISKYFFTNRIKLEELKQSQMKTELEFLRNQVNPHFMFNTLNSLYVLAKQKHERLPESIMKLSDLLRYQIYEVDHKKVALKKELEYLRNYIELEEMRRSDLKVNMKIEGDQSGKEISPLILLPFIENAFKHSFTIREVKNFLDIFINITDLDVTMICSNYIGEADTKEGGIGLKNVKRRLELLYPNKYDLQVSQLGGRHKVKLALKF